LGPSQPFPVLKEIRRFVDEAQARADREHEERSLRRVLNELAAEKLERQANEEPNPLADVSTGAD
jgi:hypothetical protein